VALHLRPIEADRIASTVTEADLAVLRVKYQIPASVHLRVPGPNERANAPRFDELSLYVADFEAGLRLPFHPCIREVLWFLGLSPGQLLPNAWRILVSCSVLWAAATEDKARLTPEAFLYCHQVSMAAQGWWYFSRRDNTAPAIEGLPSANKRWKDKFFFLSGEGWEFPAWEERTSASKIRVFWGEVHPSREH
jgi:hypothetical protein